MGQNRTSQKQLLFPGQKKSPVLAGLEQEEKGEGEARLLGGIYEKQGFRGEKMKKAKKGLIWADLVKIEPALLDLAKEAMAYKKASRGKDYVCANDRWYGQGEWNGRGLREQIISLVGWLSENPELKTTEAYDFAYQYIYCLLPDCRNCGCLVRKSLCF